MLWYIGWSLELLSNCEQKDWVLVHGVCEMWHNFVSCCMFSNVNHQELVITNQLISELEVCFPYQEYMDGLAVVFTCYQL